MNKSLCHDCIYNCTDRKHNSSANHNGIWCNAEYGRVINKKVKGCKNYRRKRMATHYNYEKNLLKVLRDIDKETTLYIRRSKEANHIKRKEEEK